MIEIDTTMRQLLRGALKVCYMIVEVVVCIFRCWRTTFCFIGNPQIKLVAVARLLLLLWTVKRVGKLIQRI